MTTSEASFGRSAALAVEPIARKIVQDCVLRGGSVLTPQHSIWSTANLTDLRRRLTDMGARDFFEQFAQHSVSAQPGVIQLCAEVLLLNMLPLINFKADTKVEHIQRILNLMAQPIAVPTAIQRALQPGGVFNGGSAFMSYRRDQLKYLVDVALHLRGVGGGKASLDRTDPIAFRSEIDHVQTKQVVQRNALLYMAFPQFFLPIVNAGHRIAIRDAFSDYLQHLPGDVDADLAEINQALMTEQGGQIDFYQSPWKDRWQKPKDTAQPTDAVQHAWRVRGSDVIGMDVVPLWVEQGIVSLAAKLLRPVDPETITRDELKLFVEEDYRTSGYAARQEKFDEFYSFLTRMHVGDLVVTVSRQMLFIGTITGDAESVASDDGRSNLRRTVKWESHRIPVSKIAASLTALISSASDVTDLSAELDTVRMLMGRRPQTPPTREANLPDATPELAERLHVPQHWLQECIELLRDRPQLIFYGPPGTGKTYLAQALAEHLAPDGNVKVVQFHPSYSYEDFFEGYRPIQVGHNQIGYDLKPGPLRRIVEKAAENPTAVYVLIIDEINRGNLAKIFGELYFLLEYRDSAIDLMYRSENDAPFRLPKNLVLFGTMNTADRSIALVDAAMRRRFAFVPLHPAQAPTDGVLRSWLLQQGYSTEVAELLDELNSRITDADFKIGPSYFMRPAVHQPGGLERVWHTAILPLLEEHHYGDRTIDVIELYGLPTLRAAITPAMDSIQELGDAPTDAD